MGWVIVAAVAAVEDDVDVRAPFATRSPIR
jgi:hypothetical protein